MIKTNCLRLPPFSRPGPSQNFPPTCLFLPDNGFKPVSHSLKKHKEHEQACPYGDGIFKRDTHWGGHYCCWFYERLQYCCVHTHSGTYRRGGNGGMVNYICVTHLPAFNNSFVQFKTCDFYYQSVRADSMPLAAPASTVKHSWQGDIYEAL